MTLTERIVALHAALHGADIPHAFGGALALAFCTAEPRGTQDIDVNVFLSNHPFHDHAEADRRHVAFAGIERLPVLACQDLAVFKAFFARAKDVVDVATMVSLGSVDLDALEGSVEALLGDGEQRSRFFERVAEAVPEI